MNIISKELRGKYKIERESDKYNINLICCFELFGEFCCFCNSFFRAETNYAGCFLFAKCKH
jgi:hypothetical protein